MASSAELATLLGFGGVVGVLAGLSAAGKRFSAHLSSFADSLEEALREPRRADLPGLARQARLVEKDASSLLGMFRQVFRN